MLEKLVQMWHALQVGKRFEEPDFTEIEQLLQAALVPVSPRPQYQRELGRRLAHTSLSAQAAPELKLINVFILGFVSVLSGMLLVILGVKTVTAILAGLGLSASLHRQAQTDKINSPFRPVA